MKADAPLAPAHRVPRSEMLAQLRHARASGRIPDALDLSGEPIAVLDEHRQLIFANRAFSDLAGGESLEELCGGRPGEILGCIHAGETEEGCGTSDSCRFCGAARAIRETQETGRPAARECHLSASESGRIAARDFLVRTVPFDIGECRYVLASFGDISAQKRRAALERIFFHDILNTASSFKLYLDLLLKAGSDKERRGLLARLEAISDTLVEEVQGQKVLVSAESGTLKTQRSLIDSHALATQLVGQLEGQEVARGRTLAIAPFSEKGYPSDGPCGRIAACLVLGSTTRGPTPRRVHGSPTMPLVWTTWTGYVGLRVSDARPVAVQRAGS